MIGVILIIILLTLVCAIYVAAEFAAVGARRARIRRLAEEGNRFAKALLPYLLDPAKLDRYISGCQIGITLSSLFLGAYGQARLSTMLTPIVESLGRAAGFAAESVSAIVVLILLTVFQIVLSELVPKALALQYPTQCALVTVYPLRWSLVVYSIFIRALNGAAAGILRLLKMPAVIQGHIHSPDEIELMFADSRDGGLLETDEHERLQRALRLGTRPIRQVMVPRQRIAFLDAAKPMDQLLKTAIESPYSRLPVYRGNRDTIIGVLHTKDLARAIVTEDEIGSIEPLIRPVLFVPRSVTADRVLSEMRAKRKHQALVVDEYGGVEGLVTLEDILAEFLGSFGDELKKDDPTPEKLADGRVRIPGLLRLDEVGPHIGVVWEGDMDTVGGFILEVLDRVPNPGETVVIEGIEVTIDEVVHNAVRWITAKPLAEPPADTEEAPS